jgi:hypothetical protein
MVLVLMDAKPERSWRHRPIILCQRCHDLTIGVPFGDPSALTGIQRRSAADQVSEIRHLMQVGKIPVEKERRRRWSKWTT